MSKCVNVGFNIQFAYYIQTYTTYRDTVYVCDIYKYLWFCCHVYIHILEPLATGDVTIGVPVLRVPCPCIHF